MNLLADAPQSIYLFINCNLLMKKNIWNVLIAKHELLYHIK